MWNTTTLTAPPINSFPAKSVTIDLKAVNCILVNGIKCLNEKLYKALRTESLLLSRLVYRMKLQFRNDKGFKYMEKTNTLLKRFLNFDLVSDLKLFNESVPKIYEKDLYLPTKQMLQYLLVRIQGFTQLLKRIGESALNTAELTNSRIALGHLWTIAVVVLGIISRIWYLCKYFTKKCCLVYNDLLPLLDKLQLVGMQWLEDGYEFPSNLTDWLNVNWLNEQTEIVSKYQIEIPVFNLLDESDDEDVQYCYQYKLNDFFVIDDDSFFEDNDAEIIESSNKQNDLELEDIISFSSDDNVNSVKINLEDNDVEIVESSNKKNDLELEDIISSSSDDNLNNVEINLVDDEANKDVSFGGSISDSSLEEGEIRDDSDVDVMQIDDKSVINLDTTAEIIDLSSVKTNMSSVIERNNKFTIDDYDIGESVPRQQLTQNPTEKSIKKRMKNKRIKNKKRIFSDTNLTKIEKINEYKKFEEQWKLEKKAELRKFTKISQLMKLGTPPFQQIPEISQNKAKKKKKPKPPKAKKQKKNNEQTQNKQTKKEKKQENQVKKEVIKTETQASMKAFFKKNNPNKESNTFVKSENNTY